MDNLKRQEKNNTKKIIQFSEKWAEQLSKTNEGVVKNTIPNYVKILKNDEAFKGNFRWNEHSKRVEVKSDGVYHGILNLDLSKIKNIIEDKYGIYNKDKLGDALDIAASEHSYHPIKDYIESLKWDGVKRIDTAFADYFGAAETPYNAMCMRLVLLGAIERVYEPGCKFDPMLIIKGAQGLGKSTFFRYICGNDKFYQGNFKDIDKSFELTNGKWICEMAELKVLKKEDNREAIKAYLSQVLDTHTLKWKPYPEDYPRQFICIGTTNETVFLNDDTGERRFPVVECSNKKTKFKKSVFDKNGKEEVQQILAEAYEEYKNGARMYDVPDEFQEEMEKIQSGYRAENTEKGIIEEYLQGKTKVCLLQIWCEAFKHKISDKFSAADKNKIVKVLDSLPNWDLFDGAKDHRTEFKNIITGIDYQGNPTLANYGKQKAWVWHETEKDIKKRQEEELQKSQQANADMINMITGQNKTHEDYYTPVSSPVSTIDDLKQIGIEVNEKEE